MGNAENTPAAEISRRTVAGTERMYTGDIPTSDFSNQVGGGVSARTRAMSRVRAGLGSHPWVTTFNMTGCIRARRDPGPLDGWNWRP